MKDAQNAGELAALVFDPYVTLVPGTAERRAYFKTLTETLAAQIATGGKTDGSLTSEMQRVVNAQIREIADYTERPVS